MSTGVLRAGFRLGLSLGLACLWGHATASKGRAEGALAALAFGPALPGLIADIAQVAAERAGWPAWRLGPGPGTWGAATPLPRVRLVPEGLAAGASSPKVASAKLALKLTNLPARLAIPDTLREPPALRFERGLRTVSLRPEFRVTSDRRGAFFLVRGSF